MEVEYNIWDNEIAHCDNLKEAGLRCGVRNNSLPINYDQNLKWVKRKNQYKRPEKSGVSFFTDGYLSSNFIKSIDSDIKIGWIIEPKAHHPQSYQNVEGVENLLDFVFTIDEFFLKNNPEKYKFLPADWVCVEPESHSIAPKKNLVSMIYSNKGSLDRTLRGIVANKFLDKLDLFGSGSPSGELDIKSLSLNNYAFSIAMENSIANNYYTETNPRTTEGGLTNTERSLNYLFP